VLQPIPAELEDLADTALYREPPQQLENHVLTGHPRAQTPDEPHQHHLGHAQPIGFPGHRHGHVQAAGTHSQHSQRARHRRVAVRAQEHAPRDGKPLQVYLVADAVARPAVEQPVARRERAQEAVVVGVLEADLQHVVIHVDDRGRSADALDPHRLELHRGHRAGGVLQQRLLDVQGDLPSGERLTLNQMRADNLLADRPTHCAHLC